MKKLLIPAFLALLIFFYILPSAVIIHAQDESSDSAMTTEKVEYTLPYPGILPDNPLHFLKAARDRIILFLISDPLKKAEFNLLTSDKRIYAARLLAEKGKDNQAVSTLSKSNNYMHQAVSSAQEAKKVGQNVDIVLHNLELSIKKHKEVLSTIQNKVDNTFSGQLQSEGKRLQDLEISVNKLNPK